MTTIVTSNGVITVTQSRSEVASGVQNDNAFLKLTQVSAESSDIPPFKSHFLEETIYLNASQIVMFKDSNQNKK